MPETHHSIPSLAPRFPLTVLIVENNPLDAELCIDFLAGAQFDLTVDIAQTPEEFVEKLQIAHYDVILADYHLGSWTGMDALGLLQEHGRDIPFILLTAGLGEQTAVECMKRGLADYVLRDRIDRLPVAIFRALEQGAARSERRRVERIREQAEAKFRALAEFMPAAVFLEQGSKCSYANRAAEAVTGFARVELKDKSFWQLVPEESRAVAYAQLHRSHAAELPEKCRTHITTKSGAERWLECTVKVLQIEGGLAELITAVPIARPAEQLGSGSRFGRTMEMAHAGPALHRSFEASAAGMERPRRAS